MADATVGVPGAEHSADALPQLLEGAVVTVGTFDGVHLGHRDILRRLHEHAADTSCPALLVTFRPHPLEVVNPSAAPMLLTPGLEQLDALADSGPLLVVALPFTQALASYSAESFVRDLLVRRYRVRRLVIGYDHGLGRGRGGDAQFLEAIGRQIGFDVDVVAPTLDSRGIPISSSGVRTAVAHGDLAFAHAALGRHYSFRGTVAPGHQRGRELGFPTLNLELASARKLLPPAGVYAVRAHAARGTFGGMMNLGARPTFGEFDRMLEVHLFEASGDWYGESVGVELIGRLRDTVKFESIEALVAQLGRDAEAARLALTQA
jgi:riboflavin kinase / FMN adenylyltransferase